MLKYFSTFITIVLLTVFSFAQSSDTSKLFIDVRDQTVYPVVQIGAQRWLGTDLKYRSPSAYFQDSTAARIGNFYYWEEAQEVCPEGWRLTTKEDWANFAIIIMHEKIKKDPNVFMDMEAFLINRIDQLSVVFQYDKEHSFWEDNTPLKFIPMGRIEQEKTIASRQFTDYWVCPLSDKHRYYHIHLRRHSLEGHSHKHHVHSKSKKRRMFKIRCVQE